MSAPGSWLDRPSRPTNATLNFRNAWFSSIEFGSASQLGLRVLKPPPERSPRWCIGPLCSMPRRVCVVIGPFSGWKSMAEEPLPSTSAGLPGVAPLKGKTFTNGLLFRITAPSGEGAPRSHASESKSEKTWHEPQDASPFDDDKRVSNMNGRPLRIDAGSGVCTARWLLSLEVSRLTTETPSSKRVYT